MKARHYQKKACELLVEHITTKENDHPLIALPTGSGKTVVMSEVVRHINKEWPEVKILILSHVSEILTQDHTTLKNYLNKPIGLYSAGLKSKTIEDITVAGIQSVFRKPEIFKNFKFVIIDECHLISPNADSMYQKFLGDIGAIYLGLTATPFRLGDGYIHGKGMLFDSLIYDLTRMEDFNKLIDEGFLCSLRVRQTQLELDTKGLHTRGGEFIDKEMSLAFNKEQITEAAIKEVCKIGGDYKKWLIFAIDIEHAESIAETLIQMGIPTGLVHSKMEFNRGKTITMFKEGVYKAVVNVNILTTGFDDPEIDLIALLRPTQSPVVHVQTIGRGLRIAPGKEHCMILDFAGNTKRLGPINNVRVNKRAECKEDGEAITKTCPECNTIFHPSVKKCDVCGHIFEFKTALTAHASSDEVVTTGRKWHKVNAVYYNFHSKPNTPDMIKVSYVCGIKTFNEYWCLDHKGYARFRAVHLILNRGGGIGKEHLASTADAMCIVDKLNKPSDVLISTKKKYPEVLKYKF